MAKQSTKKEDKRIDNAYRSTCNGIQVNMMDIPLIFEAGRYLIQQGATDEDLAKGIRTFVEAIRQN